MCAQPQHQYQCQTLGGPPQARPRQQPREYFRCAQCGPDPSAFRGASDHGLMIHMVQKHGEQQLLQERVAQRRNLDHAACVACDTITSQRCHDRSWTAERCCWRNVFHDKCNNGRQALHCWCWRNVFHDGRRLVVVVGSLFAVSYEFVRFVCFACFGGLVWFGLVWCGLVWFGVVRRCSVLVGVGRLSVDGVLLEWFIILKRIIMVTRRPLRQKRCFS